MKHLSLFSGIGGIDIAAEWAGFEMVCFVENNNYCQKVLRKHWPDVPIMGDIKDVTKEKVAAYANQDSESRLPVNDEARCRELVQGRIRNNNPAITLITGGFPCQPVSHAGKRRGKDDDRWLWPEMLRVISEVRSTWVVAENVAGLINMGLDGVLSDLEGIGYEVQAFLIPACGVDAPHRRNRIFIVAHTRCKYEAKHEQQATGIGESGDVADTISGTERAAYWQGSNTGRSDSEQDNRDSLGDDVGNGSCEIRRWWPTEPDVGRVAHGVPSRVDRLKCLGNAVVPQQIYPILKAIADIERNNHVY